MKESSLATLLIALWLVVLVILLTPETPGGHGLQHARFAAMDQGGDGAQRHRSLLISCWVFGSLLIALFVSLLAWPILGPSKQTGVSDPPPRMVGWLGAFIGGGLIYEAVFTAMCLAYRNSLTDPANASFLGPFPAGVSWLLFGVWLIPGCFIALYVRFFDTWIAPPESLKDFAELVSRSRKSQSRESREV